MWHPEGSFSGNVVNSFGRMNGMSPSLTSPYRRLRLWFDVPFLCAFAYEASVSLYTDQHGGWGGRVEQPGEAK